MSFINSPSSDEKVKISSTDTTTAFLLQKILSGTGITVTQNNIGGNETLTISFASGSGISWDLLGNTSTTPGTHFLGTTDNKDVVFKTNANEAMRLQASTALRMISGAVVKNTLNEAITIENDYTHIHRNLTIGLSGSVTINAGGELLVL